ncbi:MAG TPA: hypothetical protein VMU98_01230 [Acidimicrobiales bacterium]|nr:hypothetical protein [Acidimicrobiales bacterium]
MTVTGSLGLDFNALARRRRRQRAITVVAIGVIFLTSAGYWLGNSGVLGTTITPLAGTTNGAVASVSSSTLSGSVTQSGHLTKGVPVSRITVATSYLDNATSGKNIKITLAWTNAMTATLHGNDLVSVGLWYPVSTSSNGSCHSGTLYVADSGVSGGPTGVCVVQDTAATGSSNVDTASGDAQQGSLMLSKAQIGGYLLPGTGFSGTIALCTADVAQSTWCQPPGIGDQSGNTNRSLYVLAQVVNNGGNVPPGQQPSPGDFAFYTGVNAIG